MKSFSDSFDSGKGSLGGHDAPGPYSKGIETGQDKKEESVGEPKFSNRVETGQKVPFEESIKSFSEKINLYADPVYEIPKLFMTVDQIKPKRLEALATKKPSQRLGEIERRAMEAEKIKERAEKLSADAQRYEKTISILHKQISAQRLVGRDAPGIQADINHTTQNFRKARTELKKDKIELERLNKEMKNLWSLEESKRILSKRELVKKPRKHKARSTPKELGYKQR